MTYTVKEIFYSLQGEGGNVGRPAVFLRFAGCNLWNGREQHRANAVCKFCDTQFVGGKKYNATQLADAVERLWPGHHDKFIVVTGGEPALQFDAALESALRRRHFEIAMETNGTIALDGKPDWVTVSPKTKNLVVTRGDELKFVFPQRELSPDDFSFMDFNFFYLQPMDLNGEMESNTVKALAYCLSHPQWRLSQQTHKRLGLR